MKWILLALVSLFLFSCAPYQFTYSTLQSNGQTITVAPVYIEDTWNDTDRAQLHAAIDQWNKALNGKMILTIENDHYHFIKDAPQNKLMLLTITEEQANKHEQYISLAWTHARGNNGVGGNRIYFVRSRIKDDELYYVALHELGHALGSDHIQYNGLMKAIFNKQDYRCIDHPALLNVANYQHLNMHDLKWCR